MESQISQGGSNQIWRCSLCPVFVALTLRVLMNHIYTVHSNKINFFVRCGVNNCPATFQRYHSFYKHVKKKHDKEYEGAKECNSFTTNFQDHNCHQHEDSVEENSLFNDCHEANFDPSYVPTEEEYSTDSDTTEEVVNNQVYFKNYEYYLNSKIDYWTATIIMVPVKSENL